MDNARFTKLVDETWGELTSLLHVKGGEYSGYDDRLANFKRSALDAGTTPLQALLIFMGKHYDAVKTYIRDDAAGNIRPASEPIDGRVHDLINYLLLFKAMLVEDRERVGQELGHFDPTPIPRDEKIEILLTTDQHIILASANDCAWFLEHIAGMTINSASPIIQGHMAKAWKYFGETTWRTF